MAWDLVEKNMVLPVGNIDRNDERKFKEGNGFALPPPGGRLVCVE
jgi:hypothetical protein